MRCRCPRFLPLLAAALVVGGCSLTRPPDALPSVWLPPPAGIDLPSVPVSTGALLLGLAEQYLGAPYRYGGSAPDGFDCSGLVLRVHALAGIGVPRTALEQQAAAQPVPRVALLPGDLLFFAGRRGRVDHVGIYAGDGRFVHAPRTGRPVGYDRLDDSWFATRFVGAGRFWTVTPPAGMANTVP